MSRNLKRSSSAFSGSLRDRFARAKWVRRWIGAPDQMETQGEVQWREGSALRLEEGLARLEEELRPAMGLSIFVSGQPRPLRPEIQEQVYLIGREALVNALRHSQATSIEAEVQYLAAQLRVLVRDNGCGIDPKVVESGRNVHRGFSRMSERAARIGASLRLWSRPGAGTELEISVPNFIADAQNRTGPGSTYDSDRAPRTRSADFREVESVAFCRRSG